MSAVFAEVGFKGNRKDYFVLRDLDVTPGEHVVVEADRGEDLGRLLALGGIAERKCSASGGCGTPIPERRVLRAAREQDLHLVESLRRDEDRVRRETRSRVAEHGLRMKVTEAEWQFDRKKLTIYFTAERRVDFRALVRDLASAFRTRIELRQIGVRDESALLGGVGRCGRELCCSTWLPELRPVSLQLAKDQNLSLNPSQISGCCGRLMCCLMYEHDTYIQARRRFPREGRTLSTSRGRERVVGLDIWTEHVTLRSEDGDRRTLPLDELRREVQDTSPLARPAPGAAAEGGGGDDSDAAPSSP
ncbi:MAG: stage 0 sporulation protein [Gemmatimonadales bacterium]|nr:MAG: stage 0 sporulation protein [Gemmatimonadales bacterium]